MARSYEFDAILSVIASYPYKTKPFGRLVAFTTRNSNGFFFHMHLPTNQAQILNGFRNQQLGTNNFIPTLFHERGTNGCDSNENENPSFAMECLL